MDQSVLTSTKYEISKGKLKKLYFKIKTQMEFYFSDSNLVKDVFLQELIRQDPNGFVELNVFKSFNKIKVLTEDVNLIAAAVSRSDMLQLSEDGKKVKRVSPLSPSKDFDACTVFVEKLPPYADQKWVKDVFEHFGRVDYVNVPQFSITHKIKGFAFVEFQSPESVKRACDFYKFPNGKESMSEDDVKDLKAGKRKRSGDSTDKKHRKNKDEVAASISSEKSLNEEIEKSDSIIGHSCNSFNLEDVMDQLHSTPIGQKRKCEDSEEEIIIPKKSKRDDDEVVNVMDKEFSGKISGEKDEIMEQENAAESSENIAETSEKSKSKRKRKNSKRNRTDRPILRVMTKAEWKSYRNKYLDLQRVTMSYLKKTVLLQTQQLREQDLSSKSIESTTEIPKKGLQFQPGVIIKIKLNKPVKNSTDVKDQVKANAIVAYVDAPVDESNIYVRCHTPEEAQAIINEGKLNHLGCAELLKDEEESKYWEKIESDRRIIFNNPVATKKRGRDKIIAKAAKLEEMKNKHIFFDE